MATTSEENKETNLEPLGKVNSLSLESVEEEKHDETLELLVNATKVYLTPPSTPYGGATSLITTQIKDEFAKYRLLPHTCCYECSSFCKNINNIILFILSIFFLLIFMLPMLLIIGIFGLCCGTCCCDVSDFKPSRNYQPSHGNSLNLFATLRLKLSQRDPTKRGCLWFIFDSVVGFYQVTEYCLEKDKIKYINTLANKYGDYFPYLWSIGCVESNKIVNNPQNKLYPSKYISDQHKYPITEDECEHIQNCILMHFLTQSKQIVRDSLEKINTRK